MFSVECLVFSADFNCELIIVNCELKHMRSYGRSMGGLTGGVRWGVESVKSLIKNELAKNRGGLG